MAIHFFTEDISFNLPQKLKRKNWLKALANEEGFVIKELNYVFCSDEYLLDMNQEYLDHDTYTDIITFDNSENQFDLEGDIFISVDRVKENADKHRSSVEQELNRVISHGLFHLAGYKDKSKSESIEMREKEEFAIDLFERL